MREDRYSNDLEGAAGWQAYHGDDYDDRPSRADLAAEAVEAAEDDCDEDEDEDYDDCGCADPGCPCGGMKRGGAP